MFSTDSFSCISLMALALAARRVASGSLNGRAVGVRPIDSPESWWAGSVHPDRGYVLECGDEIVAEVVELDGRAWADWGLPFDTEGAAAFESRLIAEADAARAVASCIRSLDRGGCRVVGAGQNVVGQAAGNDPVAWFDYEDEDGRTDRVYFHGDAECAACLRWAEALRLA